MPIALKLDKNCDQVPLEQLDKRGRDKYECLNSSCRIPDKLILVVAVKHEYQNDGVLYLDGQLIDD